jgi:hypothetical protein
MILARSPDGPKLSALRVIYEACVPSGTPKSRYTATCVGKRICAPWIHICVDRALTQSFTDPSQGSSDSEVKFGKVSRRAVVYARATDETNHQLNLAIRIS